MKTYGKLSVPPPVIILAAGLSERMGFPKAFIKWDYKTTFIEKVISEYLSFGSREIILVLNCVGLLKMNEVCPHIEKLIKIAVNKEPEKGRLSSILTGLSLLQKGKGCFIHNADNPNVSFPLLAGLTALSEPNSYVVPVYKGKGGHPVLISAEVIRFIISHTDGDISLRDILKNFRRVEFISDDPKVLLNINTPEDYDRLKNSIEKNDFFI